MKEDLKPDLIIANVENLAHGKGVTKAHWPSLLPWVFMCLLRVIIFGINPVFEIMKDETYPLFRPANYPPSVEGKGAGIIQTPSGQRVLIINLMGRVFFKESLDCPFRKADEILQDYKKDKKIAAIFVDFHAEATSEKVAMGHYLDGRVSAVVGTHIQVPTADYHILKGGTAFITDVGPVGAKDSIIGVAKEGPLKQFLSQKPGGGFDIREGYGEWQLLILMKQPAAQ